ncbi:LADA_0F13212g1_1 [Lachancea dasiensis]|uniref:Cx9C motif-containing protein 4, mitochondrial n=1 Tax=Lachancea dasiensis TaxID=1072105 RepID=A0A1G4JMQ3_9SACH|nr:LADA_0F13212g1_1 [Lachancea dasiensis]
MPDPCKPQACAIQACLNRTGYDESKCTQLIDQLYECCTKFYQEQGAEARSPCCPIPKLLNLKLQQRRKEQLDAKLL